MSCARLQNAVVLILREASKDWGRQAFGGGFKAQPRLGRRDLGGGLAKVRSLGRIKGGLPVIVRLWPFGVWTVRSYLDSTDASMQAYTLDGTLTEIGDLN